MSADITAILEDLAAGRIDTAEANRRIADARGQEQPAPGSQSGPAEGTGPRRGASEDETSGGDKGPLAGFAIPPEAKEGLRLARGVRGGRERR